MNIFVLSSDPVEAAQLQCNAHCVKMPLESAQMLSTAHRILDGKSFIAPSKSGKRLVKHWKHPEFDDLLYKAVHVNHPCTTWTMKSESNYKWHYDHFIALCEEYTHRYGRVHKSELLLKNILKTPPKCIPTGPLTKHPLAMKSNPECMDESDIIGSYRAFYQTKQSRFKMVWTKRTIPDWFDAKDQHVS